MDVKARGSRRSPGKAGRRKFCATPSFNSCSRVSFAGLGLVTETASDFLAALPEEVSRTLWDKTVMAIVAWFVPPFLPCFQRMLQGECHCNVKVAFLFAPLRD